MRSVVSGTVTGIACGFFLSAIALGSEINGYSNPRNDRFTSGYPSSPVANTADEFIGDGYDWSGVGWRSNSSTRSYALLGPRHVLYASHYSPGVGATINFTSADGQVEGYTVQAQSGSLAGDLAVAALSAPIPDGDNICSYSILFKGYSASAYVGSNLLVYGKPATSDGSPRVGWNQIDEVGQFFYPDDSGYYYTSLSDLTTPDRTRFVSGDSGSPSFIVTGASGEMYLAGAHYSVSDDDPALGIDTMLAMMLPTIGNYMAKTGYLPYVVTPVTARWTGDSSGNWGASGNWSSGSVPADIFTNGKVTTCASLLFDGAATTRRTISLGANRTVTGIAFADAAGANVFTFDAGSTLTLGEAGLTNRDDEAQTLNCGIALRTSQRWDVGRGGLTVGGAVNTGSGAGSNAYLLLVEGAGNANLNGVISGTGGLAKDGAGTLALGSASGNSYTGKTFINGGTLAIGRDDHLGAAPGSVVAGQLTINGGTLRATESLSLAAKRGITLGSLGGVIAVDDGKTLTGNSVIAGAAAPLAMSGAGILELKGNNTYSGATTVNQGTLVVSGAAGDIAQSSAYTVNRGTLKLDNSGGNNTATGNRLGDNSSLSLKGGTFQVVANSNGTTETLGNVAALLGENTYDLTPQGAGSSTITNGTLARAAGATLNFTGTLNNANKIVFSGVNTGFINQGTFVNGADYAVYDAAGYVRAMIVGSDVNDYATSVAADRHVRLSSTAANQDSVSLRTLTLTGSGVGFTLDSGQTLTLANGGLVKTGGGDGAVIGGGNGLTATGEYVVRTDAASDQLTIGNVLAGGTGLTKSGQGMLVLANAGNSYGGATLVTAGTLKLGAAGAIPVASNLVVTGTATFDLGGYDGTSANLTIHDGTIKNTGAAATLSFSGNTGTVTYAGVSGGGTISVNTLNLATAGTAAASHAFTVADGQADADLTVSSIIADGSTNAQSLVKAGGGTLRLTGGNTYTGGTTINAGVLALGASDVFADASNVTVNGGTLAIGAYSDTVGTVTLQSGAICGTTGMLTGSAYEVQSGTIGAILGGMGVLTKSTSGTVALAGVNAYSGGTSLDAGTLSVGSDSHLGGAAGGLTFNGGALQVTGTAFTGTTRAIAWNANGGAFDIADSSNTFTLTQSLGGAGQLTKIGLGTLQANGAIGSSSVTVQDGTLRLGGADRFTAAPAVSVVGTATLDLNGYNNTVGAITMTGGSIATGAGTLTIGGDVTGNRSIWPASISGKLDLGSATRNFNVADGAPVDLTVSANISGTGVGLVKTGAGTLVLTGANVYSGATTVNAGVLRFGSTAAISSGTTITTTTDGYAGLAAAASNSNFIDKFDKANSAGVVGLDANTANAISLTGFHADARLGSSTSATLSGVFTPQGSQYRFGGGGGTITIGSNLGDGGGRSLDVGTNGSLPAGTVLLTGNNSYTGATTVGAGTLRLGHAWALGTTAGDTTVFSGATLDLNGITVGSETVRINGTGVKVISGTSAIYGGAMLNSSSTAASLGGNVVLASNSSIGGSGNITLNGQVSGGYTLTKVGSGTLTFGNSNTYSGATKINAGTLALGVSNAIADGSNITISGTGATLDIADYSDTVGTVTLQTSGVISGAAGILTGSSYAVQSGTISAILGGNGALTKTTTGTVTLNKANTYSGNTNINAGKLKLGTGGGIASTLINIGSGAIFDVATVGGGFTLDNGQTLKGVGTVSGAMTVGSGSVLSPGGSPGALTTGNEVWAGGGTYQWELDRVDISTILQPDTLKGCDPGFDFLNVNGALDITSTLSDKFVIDIDGLLHSTHTLGEVANWNPTRFYSWTIATASEGISGFDADKFTLDTSDFTANNPLGPGYRFTISVVDNNLRLDYVPEPGALLMLLTGFAVWFAVIARRRACKPLDPGG